MAAVEVTISGVLYDKLSRTSRPVVLIGEATLTGLGVGGGPIEGGPGGSPPGIWGPTDPRPGWGLPGPQPPSGGPPGIWGPTDPRPGWGLPDPPPGKPEPIPPEEIPVPPDPPAQYADDTVVQVWRPGGPWQTYAYDTGPSHGQPEPAPSSGGRRRR